MLRMSQKMIFCLTLGLLFILNHPVKAEEAAQNKTKAVQENPSKLTSRSQCNEFTFDASRSYHPEGHPLNTKWDFGDGITSDQVTITHIYQESGQYKVKLTVTDPSLEKNNVSESSQVIRVNIPPQASFSAPEIVCAGQDLKLNGQVSKSEKIQNMSYLWDFGDGTNAQGASVQKNYKRGGKYNIKLTGDDNSKTACSTDQVEKTILVNEAPLARAGRDTNSNCSGDPNQSISFDASTSSDPEGNNLTYVWDFGDGQTAEGKKVSHTYQKGNIYDVTLTVKDDSGLPQCNHSVDSIKVNVNKAPVAKAGGNKTACLGQSVTLDGTASLVDEGGILFSQWDFGDGTSERGLKLNHTYRDPGKYRATLTVENAHNLGCPFSNDSVEIQVNRPPEVHLKAPLKTCAGGAVSFEALANDLDHDKMQYYWSFGDGIIQKGGAKISHTYEKGGKFKVSVTVDDTKGSDCSSASASSVIQINSQPKAMAAEVAAAGVGETVTFDGLKSLDSDGDRLNYAWDFADGSKSHDALSTHIYSKGGTYNVRLTVDDNTGSACSSDTTQMTIKITQPPVSVIEIK